MSGKRLLKRILLVWGAAAFACLFLIAVDGDAAPLRPDIRKLVAQPSDTVQFAPARAGWNGPENARASSPVAESSAVDLSGEAAKRATRAALLTAALPDPRAVVAIVAAILLLRLLRDTHHRQARRAEVLLMPRSELPPEERAA